VLLTFSGISQICFCIEKSWIGSMDDRTTAGSRSMVDSRPWGDTAASGLERSW
jgi:hypothetical protein